MLQPDTINWLQSLPTSELKSVLSKMPREKQIAALAALSTPTARTATEQERDLERKRDARSASARIVIPECVNPKRRELCLEDPERFLRTYFPDRYKKDFCKDHRMMMEVMVERAKRGGRQAIAAPRRRGKSEITKGTVAFLIFAGMIRFPVAIAATTDHAHKLYSDFRSKLATNDLLLEDFPEVCFPIRALDGAPQRASKQHVDGQLTRIVWTANDYLSLPHVKDSIYGGVKFTYFGLDSAIRGINIDGDRPDFVIVDDPETEESARSIDQIDRREKLLDQDIAGLAGPDRNLAIVLLTTIQNRYCLSYRVTDRTIKPAWNGLRYGMIVKWPTRMDMWEDYVTKRRLGQQSGDQYGMEAIQFYLANRSEMDAGCEMLTDDFVRITLDDGTECVHSTLQQCWNVIADTSMAAFRTEQQNDPEAEEAIETLNLTASRVQSHTGRTQQNEIPKDSLCTVMGLDIGKHASHWTHIAAEEGATGTIFDYGVMETHGLNIDSDNQAIERALLASLEVFADELKAEGRLPLLCLIDSGTYTAAVYEFCRRYGAPFYPSKGWSDSRFRMPQRSHTKEPFEQCYAHVLDSEQLYLYNVNTEYWKQWTQQRFFTSPFNAAGDRVPGSFVLFDPGPDKKRHLSFSHHIVSEEQRLVPVYGKEIKREWVVKSRNNHWLDATALASCAMSCVGIRLIDRKVENQQPETQPQVRPGIVHPWGQPFVAMRNV